jgi:PKD repeat protein
LNGTITLNDSLHITTLNLSRDSICPNDTTSISINPATGGSGIGYTYNWFDNNNNAVGTGLNITVSPSSSPTTYTVVVGDNCTTPTVIQSVTVYWLPLPQPSFIANNTSGCYPILTLFTNTTPNSTNINNVTWNFGDGGISNDILNTSHLYNTPSCYDVTLTVTSIDGCIRDTTIEDVACAYDYPIADFMMNPQPTDITNPLYQLH